MDISRWLLAAAGRLGVLAGFLMLLKPDGTLVNMQTAWLYKTPVDSYFLPSIVVGIGFGIVPILLTKQKFYTRKNVLAYALLALTWLLFEAIVFDLFHWLQAAMAFLLVGVVVFMRVPKID